MTDNVKVLIVDDHPLFRDALEVALIKSAIKPRDIKSVSTVSDAVNGLTAEDFNLVLLDLNLSDSQGFEGLSRIKAANALVPVIIVSATETAQAYGTAKSLGASAYIPKSSPLDAITDAIKSVLAGEEAFPEGPSDQDSSNSAAAEKLASLTPAQHRVMSCLSEGLLNKQIAFEMGISEATVKAHMTAIFRKLGANNRTQALLVFRDATRL
ncbi:response regulator transcription factor [Fretibacter rubidus]|uniref:response regulator transcription factor n=1 Tax=Fretibacter rubidus TaxID=570162 RepID=UPI00352B799A